MINKVQIEKIIQEQIGGSDLFLVDILVKPKNKIFVFVDGDEGITIKDCTTLSRHIESQFDRDKEDFELVVSSPGLDQPLKLPRQFKKNIDKMVAVSLTDGSMLEGKLSKADENGIGIFPEIKIKKKKALAEEEKFLSFSEINEVKIRISFK